MPRGVESGFTAPLQARTERALTRVAPLLSNIPLANEVPHVKERLVRQNRVETANHELNHAIVARSFGMSVLGISVKDGGNILGITTFSGGNLHDIAVVAAAGAVDTVDGKASGYGSDKYKAELIHHHYGGHSFDAGKTAAEEIIAEYSPDLRRKASEIIAYLGEVPGAILPDVIRRAQYELDMEKYEKSGSTNSLLVPYEPNSLAELMTDESDVNRQAQKKFAHIQVIEDGKRVDRFVIVDDEDEKKKKKEAERRRFGKYDPSDSTKDEEENKKPKFPYVEFDVKNHGKAVSLGRRVN